MKVHEDSNNIAIFFNSVKEYIDQLFDKDLETLASEIKRRPSFTCVESYADLLSKMNYDEEFVNTYNGIKADVYLPSKKSVAVVKKWRDSGNHFSYTRYMDGRPCVWKAKRIEYEGGKQSRTVPIIINLGEPWYREKKQMAFKALAAAEMVKAIQSQGRNAEVYVADFSGRPTKGRYDLLLFIKVKGGAEPLVIPRLLSSISPYFFRCFLMYAQRDFLRYKSFTPTRNNIFTKGHGYAKSIVDNRKQFDSLIRGLGIAGVDNAIIIDTGEVRGPETLKEFRAKHGITIH